MATPTPRCGAPRATTAGCTAAAAPEELDRLLGEAHELRAEEERRPTGPFEIHVISMDAYTLDGIKRLEDKGVTDVIVGFRMPYIMGPDTQPLDDKIRNLEKYASKVIVEGLTPTGHSTPVRASPGAPSRLRPSYR